MRNTFSLLIQIPFFIAAYSYLSHLEALKGARFLFISDLGAPDALVKIGGGGGINLLPVLMTVINIAAGAVYTKGFPARDKAQLYGMAAVFLLFLYNSPAGLVLYWTINNVFSLAKNILYDKNSVKKILYTTVTVLLVFAALYLLIFHKGAFSKRLVFSVLLVLLIFIPVLLKKAKAVIRGMPRFCPEKTILSSAISFVLPALLLFLLSGLVIPSSLVASSVIEFSFLPPHESPFPFIVVTAAQSAGIFLFWPACIYFLSGESVKKGVRAVMFALSLAALLNTFVFPANYGFLTPDLRFSEDVEAPLYLKIVNLAALAALFTVFLFLTFSARKKLILNVQKAAVLALACMSAVNGVEIARGFHALKDKNQAEIEYEFATLESVYTFSRGGKNVLVIMLDRAISGYVPYIFEEKPELLDGFSGFTYYPNCISFGAHTIFGGPAIFGGYEYTPRKIQKRDTERLIKKYDESMLVLPKIFADNSFKTTVSDQPFSGRTLYGDFPEIKNVSIIGKYTGMYMIKNGKLTLFDYSGQLEKNLTHYSLCVFTPLIFREDVYDDGDYLSMPQKHAAPKLMLDNYAALEYLPDITKITDDDAAHCSIIVNNLTHEPAFLKTPNYTPAEYSGGGGGPFSNEEHYYVNMAAYLLLSKWFRFLKANNVWDNTRIIIVSDHGANLGTPFSGNITLPNGEYLEYYQALLLVKDFNSGSTSGTMLHTDNSFMTNADVPFLATYSLIKNPVNPFTGKPISTEKQNGVVITTSLRWELNKHAKNKFNIADNEWLHVHDNIFDPNNWERAEK
jgi:hypothetical protein